jgi:hypothetical protein
MAGGTAAPSADSWAVRWVAWLAGWKVICSAALTVVVTAVRWAARSAVVRELAKAERWAWRLAALKMSDSVGQWDALSAVY